MTSVYHNTIKGNPLLGETKSQLEVIWVGCMVKMN